MHNHNDLRALDTEKAARRVLLAVADHFTDTNPTDALEPSSLLTCVGVEAYKAANRRSAAAPALSKAALDTLPEVADGITRGEYALHLRRATHEWTGDDNEPVIPTIPRPRTAPQGVRG